MGKRDLKKIISKGKEHDRLLIEAAGEWGVSISMLIALLIDLEVYIGIITIENLRKLDEIMDRDYPEME